MPNREASCRNVSAASHNTRALKREVFSLFCACRTPVAAPRAPRRPPPAARPRARAHAITTWAQCRNAPGTRRVLPAAVGARMTRSASPGLRVRGRLWVKGEKQNGMSPHSGTGKQK